MDLHNKTVLITRPREQSAELQAEVEGRGGRVIFFPTIRIVPPVSWDECDRVLNRLREFDAVLFTSSNGVERFVGRLIEQSGNVSALGGMALYAVGEKTAEHLGKHGLTVNSVPHQSGAEALAASLPDRIVKGKRILLPRGSLAREELETMLKERGATVESVVVYRTAAPETNDSESVSRLLNNGAIDVLTFASPSAVRNFVAMVPPAMLRDVRAHAKVAVIGRTTGDAARGLGLVPDIIAREATARGLVKAIADYKDCAER